MLRSPARAPHLTTPTYSSARRIESYPRLTAEVAAWEKQRNGAQARIDWSFTTEKARTKMGRAYPRPTNLKRPQRVKTSVPRN